MRLFARSEAPVCSRGDALLINERYDEAIAQYRKINYWPQMATAAIHAGDLSLAETTLDRIAKKNWGWYIASGDLDAAHGQLDRAVPYYEEAAKLRDRIKQLEES